MTSLLTDDLDSELLEDELRVRVEASFSNEILESKENVGSIPKTKSASNAKSLVEFYNLVRLSIEDYEFRGNTLNKYKVTFTEEEPDASSASETITFNLVRREPGAFGQGPPFSGTHRNLRPMYRESGTDSTDPNYRYLVKGYWYDNVVRFTCWARSNKAANARVEWFEDFMEEYSWIYKLQGVDRVLFWERQADIVNEVDGNKWYGRPIDYFVRTEKLRVFKEKTIQEIIVKYNTRNS